MPGTRFNLTITSSGGGALGEATIWGSVPDAGELPTENLRDGDRVLIVDTGFGTYAHAVYVPESSMWKFAEGWFFTVDDMEAFSTDPDVVRDYAIASVGGYGPAYPHYVFNADPGEWIRTPDGTKYIWPHVAIWSDLLSPTFARPYAKNDDEVHVQNLGTAHSSGTAQRHGGAWQLVEGRWTSVSDMNDWLDVPLGQSIHADARALVDPSHAWDENAVSYYWSGSAWVQSGVVSGARTHTITSFYDFSAVGITDGDYGVLTPVGGVPIVLRYKETCPVAATAGGVSRPAWMTPIAYAGSPVIQAWTDGTENNATLAAQGWTLAIGVGGTLGATDGYQRFVTAATATSVSIGAMPGAILAATKVESIYKCKGTIPNGTNVRSTQFYLADGSNSYAVGDSGMGGQTGYGYRSGTAGPVVNVPIRDVTNVRIPSLVSDPFVCVVRDEGRTVYTSVSVNGNAFADYRRNLGASASSNFYVFVTGDLTAPITLDYIGQVLTY